MNKKSPSEKTLGDFFVFFAEQMFVYIILRVCWQIAVQYGKKKEKGGFFGNNLFYIIFEKSKKGIAFFQMVVYNRFVVNCGGI